MNGMIYELVEEVFEKAENQTGKKTLYGRAIYLQTIFTEEYKEPISYKSLEDYYKRKAEPRLKLRIAMAQYLGFKDYEDYVLKKKSSEVEESQKQGKPTNYGLIVPIVLACSLIALFLGKTGQSLLSEYFGDCMFWDGKKYQRSFCIGEMEELDKLALKKMREIQVCDTITFFKNYEAQVWYDKSNNQLSYFTHYGLHPTNGKTLKPITRDIIEAHVKPCDSLD